MSKKRGKSATGSAHDSKWEVALNSLPWNEDTWHGTIVMVSPNKLSDEENIACLSDAINTGQRKLFTVVNQTDILHLVNDMGNPKAKKGKEVLPNFEICEVAKPYLDAGESIPWPLMAKLIKWKLLAIKADDVKRIELEKKGQDSGGKGGKKGAEKGTKDRGKSAKGKGGKKEPEPPSVKGDTKLRKRGEEDPDAKFIDDEPDDGSQKYILLLGFENAHLVKFMSHSGIPPDIILNFKKNSYSDETVGESEETVEEVEIKRLRQQNLDIFWRDLPLIFKECGKLSNTIVLDYFVSNILSQEVAENLEKKMEFSIDVFESVACMIYDILDNIRQWKDYNESMKLISIPLLEVTAEEVAATLSEKSMLLEDYSSRVDMRYYNDILSCIPDECITVELIMHSMLEQVDATEQNKVTPSQKMSFMTDDGLNSEIAQHFGKFASKLALADGEIKKIEEEFHVQKKIKPSPRSPLLLHPLNSVSRRAENLDTGEYIDVEHSDIEMISKLRPFSDFVQLLNGTAVMTSDLSHERKSRLQEFTHFLSQNQLSASEIDQILKQFVFECMEITSCDVNGFVVNRKPVDLQDSLVIWDDPFLFFNGLKNTLEPIKEELNISQTSFPIQSPTPSDISSRPNSAGGILKKSKSPNLERKSSVHFDSQVIEKSLENSPLPSDEIDMSSPDVLDKFDNLSSRLLDEWCFAEFFDKKTLLQVLKNATHEKPFIDAYFNKRDQSIFLVVHNPQNPDLLSNHIQWQNWLHSNTGFRNYYSYIMDNISHWTVEREAIYKASQLGEEVKNALKEEENAAAQKEDAGKKRGRAKSPPKSKSRSPNNSRPTSAEREIKNSEIYVMENSLKAQKLEAERILKEQEEEERKKAEKRSKSAQKRAEKDAEKNAKDKRPGSDKSKKSSTSASGAPEVIVDDNKEEALTPEPFWPFIGYDLEEKLPHLSGEITTMFPVDGGTIKSERTDFVNGTTAIRTSVLKDGHVFTVHIIDPVNEVTARYGENFVEPPALPIFVDHENELEDKNEDFVASHTESTVMQSSKPVSFFGSFTAVMKDGLTLALSAYGLDGKPEGIDPPIPKAYVAPIPQSSAGQEPAAVNTSRGRKSKEKLSPPPPVIEAEKTEEFEDKDLFDNEVNDAMKQDFMTLFLSCPSGQNVAFFLESQLGSVPSSKMDRRLVIKIKSKPSSSTNIPQSMVEVSRLITMDGIVIKTMKDGTSEILHPDGTVVIGKNIPITSSLLLQQENVTSQARFPTGKSKEENVSHKSGKSFKSIKNTDVNDDANNATRLQWTTYLPSGEVISHGEVIPPLQMNMASDPSNGQIMYTREDKVTMVIWTDNAASITEHADGTRITQFAIYQDLVTLTGNVDVETGEKSESSQFTLHEFSRIECPGLPTVLLNRTTGEAEVTLGGEQGRNILAANSSGMYHLQHAEGGQVSIHEDGTVLYTPRNPQETAFLHPEGLPTYTLRHHADIVCEVVDPDGNVFSVDVSGNSNVMMTSSAEEEHSAPLNDRNKILKVASPTCFKQHAPRFFVLQADGSGMEYLRYQDIAEYLALAEKDPASALVRSTFSDNYNASAITVLRPMAHVSDVWRVPYIQNSIIPNGLTSRDLKTIPPKEFKKPGPKFGTTLGRGLSVGSALKNQQQATSLNVPPIMAFRLLYQFKPIDESVRTAMKKSLLEYVKFMQQRAKDEFDLQVHEPRLATEHDKANELQQRFSTDMQEMTRNAAQIYLNSTAPLPPPIPPSPVPKRKPEDWERDQREREEEINNRMALRNKMVPNYFLSEFGKDFLLEHAVDIDTLAKRLGVFPNSASNSRPMSGVDLKKEEENLKLMEAKKSEIKTKKVESFITDTVHDDKDTSEPFFDGVWKNTLLNEKKTPVYYKSNITNVSSGSREHEPPSSLNTNVIGGKRNNAVPIPSYLKSARPGIAGNLRQFTVEDPVRRRVLTTSVTGGKGTNQLNLRSMRGLNCLPSRIDFGLLREGYTFRIVLHLINTGVETCRWKVLAPPPATGLRLRYQPGPIAAGLRAELHVEIYAIAVGVEGGSGVGEIEHNLHITTETDTLIVPISARVMTAEKYDLQPNFGYARGVTLISTAPQNTRDFLIRLGRTSPIAIKSDRA